LPIRYIPNYKYWPLKKDTNRKDLGVEDRPDIWGFLCIDSNASNAFSSQESCELGAAFADALYILFRQSAFVARQSPRPGSGTDGTGVGRQAIETEPTSGHHQAADVENASSKGRAE